MVWTTPGKPATMAGMKSLKELQGTSIALLAPAALHSEEMQKVVRHLVEDAGIWIESQTLTDRILKTVRTTMAPKTVIFFLPWSQVIFIVGSLDMPSISSNA